MDFDPIKASLIFGRQQAEAINAALAALSPLLNVTAPAPLTWSLGTDGAEIGLDLDTLSSMLPVGTTFRVGVNGTLEPVEPELNLIAGANVTITGADNPGATRTDVTIAALADGNTYIFNNDTITFSNSTITFNLDTWNITNTTITFASSDTITFNGPVILGGYVVQTPNRVTTGGTVAAFNPGTSQWVIVTSVSPDAIFQGIVAPTGTAAQIDGRFLEITNASLKEIALNDQDAGATAANRIITPDGATYWLMPGETAFLKYDGTLARWVVLWTLPHYQVNGVGPGAGTFDAWYRQCLDLEAGTNVTLTATDDPTNSRLKVKIAVASASNVTGSVVGLPTPYTVTTSYADTGLDITLPSAGTYAIDFSATVEMTNFSPGSQTSGHVNVKLYNSTAAADVANTERICCDMAGPVSYTH